MSSSSATSSERTRQMLRARMKSNIWLVQDRGPLTVITTTIPSLPSINPQPVCIGGRVKSASRADMRIAFNWFISNCKRSCNINVHVHILRIQRAKSENRHNFHKTFNPCGVRVNVNIMLKKIVTLSKFSLQIWSRNVYSQSFRELQ